MEKQKTAYEKPIVVKEETMRFPLRILNNRA